jgi:hypothetical protein
VSGSDGHDDFAVEPVPGLPARLPPGEQALWRGAPDWRSIARHAFHLRKLAIYFLVLLAWRAITGAVDGESFGSALSAISQLALLAAGTIGFLALLSWLVARTTIYTITNRRVVMRFGIALPTTFNIPFAVVESAAFRDHEDGTGDVPLSLFGDDRIAYVVLWPHARPWRFARPEPMLRGIPDAAAVANLLIRALGASVAPATKPDGALALSA